MHSECPSFLFSSFLFLKKQSSRTLVCHWFQFSSIDWTARQRQRHSFCLRLCLDKRLKKRSVTAIISLLLPFNQFSSSISRWSSNDQVILNNSKTGERWIAHGDTLSSNDIGSSTDWLVNDDQQLNRWIYFNWIRTKRYVNNYLLIIAIIRRLLNYSSDIFVIKSPWAIERRRSAGGSTPFQPNLCA